VIAQIPEVKKKHCYDRAADANKQRFASWECGKLAGYIDCNEELDYDEETNTVLKKAKDQVNISGAGMPYTGGCETCFSNGLLERRITFVNGKENGVDSTYYKSGCLQVVRNHIQGAEWECCLGNELQPWTKTWTSNLFHKRFRRKTG
jgi:antitoxin component YwqK of YwqJK toxin-antitoxin module